VVTRRFIPSYIRGTISLVALLKSLSACTSEKLIQKSRECPIFSTILQYKKWMSHEPFVLERFQNYIIYNSK